MITVSEAIKFIDREVGLIGTEKVDIGSACGRILGEKIIADIDLPPFDRSQMDGYAVMAKDVEKVPAKLRLVGESAAGSGWKGELNRDEAVRIMTGAPVPDGANAVQKLELAEEHDDDVVILETVNAGNFIVPKGKEITAGKQILSAGQEITERNIAAIASFGYKKVRVSKQPRIAILATGSEIIDIGKKPKFGQIRNSNSVMLKALAEKAGATVEIFPTCSDKAEDLSQAFEFMLGEGFDILISTGGVSVGKYDLTKEVLGKLGAKIFFDKVRIKPGKPTVFAKLGKTFIFGLPGNPVSSAAAFCLFVRHTVRLMQSANEKLNAKQDLAVLGANIKGTKERDLYFPVSISTDKSGRNIAAPVNWHGSSDLVGFAAANAFALVPAGKNYWKGDIAEIIYI